jgi:Mn2+/Fe2+ NRAMP family transporter
MLENKKAKKKNFWQKLGPGFITGAADDDPSGIATYTQSGAQFGFNIVWISLFLFPLMTAIQEMVARIGMVCGQGISAIVKKNFSPFIAYLFVFLVFLANTVNIGADLGAMADSVRLIVPGLPFVFLTFLFAILILLLEILLSYKTYAKILKWLGLSLFSYTLTLIIVTGSWKVLLTNLFIPHFFWNKDFFLVLTAILGTTISPYLFIWQSSEEVEEEIALGRHTIRARKGATPEELKAMRFDTIIGMAFSQFITFCIIGTAASVFFKNGVLNIATTGQAASALVPLVGPFASLLFSLGVIGVGLLAIPVLSASASYAFSEVFGLSEGLYKNFKQAKMFYVTIIVSTLMGLAINIIGVNPIKALFLAAVLNGIVTPILLAVILKVANNKKIMGRYTNNLLTNILGIATLLLTGISAVLIFIL